MQNRKIENKKTRQVAIDIGFHTFLKMKAAESGVSIKAILESYIDDLLTKKEDI